MNFVEKPILLTQKFKDGTIYTEIWCPFWGKKPDLEKAKEQGKLIETDKYYEIINEQINVS